MGAWFLLAANIAGALAPLIPAFRSHRGVVAAMVNGIPEAESLMGKGRGAEKSAHVVNLVKLAAHAANTEHPGAIDVDAAADAAAGVLDTIVKLTNLAHAAHGSDIAPAGV